MPSFTRRAGSTTRAPPPGTIPCPSATHPPLHLLPTGIPSLDDLYAGGLPLGCMSLILTPDIHTSWARLVERYWISQGLVTGQKSVIVGEKEACGELVKGCMWVEERRGEMSESDGEGENGIGGGDDGGGDGRTKIAWRYEKMKTFQTTVQGGPSRELSLMTTIPSDILDHLEQTGIQTYIPLNDTNHPSSTHPASLSSLGGVSSSWKLLGRVLERIHDRISGHDEKSAMRITIHGLGSIDWGEPSIQDIHRFLHAVRQMIRPKPIGVLITLPANLLQRLSATMNYELLVKRLSWVVDACVEMKGFGDDPTLPPLFHPLHGLLTLSTFPHTHHLLPPTLKHSSLLGLSSSGAATGGGGGAGENNLGFRLKRKRFMIETVHLGIEGGTSERRTEPVSDVGRTVEGVETQTRQAQRTRPSGQSGQGQTGQMGHGKEAIREVDSEMIGGMEKPRGPKDDSLQAKKPRARVRFGGEDVVPEVQIEEQELHPHQHEHGDEHGHEHGHGLDHFTTDNHGKAGIGRPTVRHDRMDLYEF